MWPALPSCLLHVILKVAHMLLRHSEADITLPFHPSTPEALKDYLPVHGGRGSTFFITKVNLRTSEQLELSPLTPSACGLRCGLKSLTRSFPFGQNTRSLAALAKFACHLGRITRNRRRGPCLPFIQCSTKAYHLAFDVGTVVTTEN